MKEKGKVNTMESKMSNSVGIMPVIGLRQKRSIALIEAKCFRANLILVRFYRKNTVRFVQVVKAFICCAKVYTFQQLFVHVIVKIQYYSFLLVFILEIYIKLCYIV